ncbi:MAG: hypothetical protein ACXQS2_04460, partial [Methermicoccaceae archaeon]
LCTLKLDRCLPRYELLTDSASNEPASYIPTKEHSYISIVHCSEVVYLRAVTYWALHCLMCSGGVARPIISAFRASMGGSEEG